jgi:hypothetical protein
MAPRQTPSKLGSFYRMVSEAYTAVSASAARLAFHDHYCLPGPRGMPSRASVIYEV